MKSSNYSFENKLILWSSPHELEKQGVGRQSPPNPETMK